MTSLSISTAPQTWLLEKALNLEATLLESTSPTGVDIGVSRSIPSRLMFNEKVASLAATSVRGRNVKRLIKLFPDVHEVEFLGDAGCSRAIERAHSKQLAMHFDAEKAGPYKSDICRLAQLALQGGYYMDSDLEMIEDMRKMIPPEVSFASVIAVPLNGTNELFQAFLAAAPGHPVILSSLDKCLDYYEGRSPTLMALLGNKLQGTLLMRLAYEEWSWQKMQPGLQVKVGEDKFKYSYLFQEEIVKDSDYPQLPPHSPAQGETYSCNVAVIDPNVRNLVAWSHVKGSFNCPSEEKDSETFDSSRLP